MSVLSAKVGCIFGLCTLALLSVQAAHPIRCKDSALRFCLVPRLTVCSERKKKPCIHLIYYSCYRSLCGILYSKQRMSQKNQSGCLSLPWLSRRRSNQHSHARWVSDIRRTGYQANHECHSRSISHWARLFSFFLVFS